jgi:hypothetical protein
VQEHTLKNKQMAMWRGKIRNGEWSLFSSKHFGQTKGHWSEADTFDSRWRDVTIQQQGYGFQQGSLGAGRSRLSRHGFGKLSAK